MNVKPISAAVSFLMMAGLFGGCTTQSLNDSEIARDMMELRSEIQTLKDVEAIKQLHIRYVNDLTYLNWDDLVDCFSENSVLEVFPGGEPVKGITAVRDAFMNEISKSGMHVGRELNLTLHPLVTVNGDKATANWAIYFITQPNNDSAVRLLQGIYDVEYVRENEKWKISHLKWRSRLSLGAGRS